MQILFVGRQREHIDAFLEQFQRFEQRRLSPDGAFFCVSMMDFAGFFGKARPDIFGGQRLLAQEIDNPRDHLVRLRRRFRLRRADAVRDMRGGRAPLDEVGAAHRATHHLLGTLLREGFDGGKPSFEMVRLGALQIDHDHDLILRFDSMCQR